MVVDNKRTTLALKYADLIQEQNACYNQYRSVIDEVQRVRLERKLKVLDQQIEKLEKILLCNDLINEDVNRRVLAVENKLYKIDFKEQLKIVKKILDSFLDYGAALFFINDYIKMAGDLFCLELKEILNQETTELIYYPIEFSIEKTWNEVAFLESLGNYVGIQDINKEGDCSKIIEKLLGLIESGSIILIELKKIDLFDERKEFISWLVSCFWRELTKNLPLACQKKDIDGVKFIIVINSDNDIFDEFSNQSFCCQNQCFNMSKIFAIFLKNWTEKDISDWLKNYSGLRKKQRNKIAEDIYKSSDGGIPNLIRDGIKSKLS